MKFSEWMTIREEQLANPSLAKAIGSTDNDPVISKMVQDIVGDKSGNPNQVKSKARKISDGLRAGAIKDAKQGKFANALDKAAQAGKITQISGAIK